MIRGPTSLYFVFWWVGITQALKTAPRGLKIGPRGIYTPDRAMGYYFLLGLGGPRRGSVLESQ